MIDKLTMPLTFEAVQALVKEFLFHSSPARARVVKKVIDGEHFDVNSWNIRDIVGSVFIKVMSDPLVRGRDLHYILQQFFEVFEEELEKEVGRLGMPRYKDAIRDFKELLLSVVMMKFVDRARDGIEAWEPKDPVIDRVSGGVGRAATKAGGSVRPGPVEDASGPLEASPGQIIIEGPES